jgi:hypothetical protein
MKYRVRVHCQSFPPQEHIKTIFALEKVDKAAMANDNSSIMVPQQLATMIKWLHSSSAVGANPAITNHEEVACSNAGQEVIIPSQKSAGTKAEQEEQASSSMVIQTTKKRKEPSPASYSSRPLTANRSTPTNTTPLPMLNLEQSGAPRPLLDVPIASICTATSEKTGGVSFLADYLSGRGGSGITPVPQHPGKRLRSVSLSELSSDDEIMKRPVIFQHQSPVRSHTLEDSLKVMMASNNSNSSSSINSNLQLLFGDSYISGHNHNGGTTATTTTTTTTDR